MPLYPSKDYPIYENDKGNRKSIRGVDYVIKRTPEELHRLRLKFQPRAR